MRGEPVVILLVEDDPAHAEIVQRCLKDYLVGNRMIHLEDGQQALAIFQRQRTTPKIRSILRIGRLTDTIAKTAQEEGVDLIILGLDERGDISSAISREILAKTEIPVLLVPNLD